MVTQHVVVMQKGASASWFCQPGEQSLDDEQPTAVFCFHDLISLYCCLQTIEEAELKIPDNISVMSSDDSALALRPKLALTDRLRA